MYTKMWTIFLFIGAAKAGPITVSDEEMTWVEAQSWCESQNLQMLSIHNDDDQTAAEAACPTTNNCWLGLYCDENAQSHCKSTDDWQWADGSTFGYANWKPGQPNNYKGRQDCVWMKGGESWLWVDFECDAFVSESGKLTRREALAMCYDDGMIHDEDGYVLIERHRDVANGYFSSGNGIENEDDPEANTYSIIGALDESEYLLNGGYYDLKLIYKYHDEEHPEDVLEWTQTSWITENTITGADLSKIVDDEQGGRRFYGLGRSNSGPTYLDGDGTATTYWWHAVASKREHIGGIPAHQSRIAYSSELWIRTDEAMLSVSGPIDVERDNIIGFVDILDEMHFEMDFTISAWPTSGWGGIFQCGTTSNDRYPLVMVQPDSPSRGFYTWFRDGAGYSTKGGYSGGDGLELNTAYHLEIDFTQSELIVSLDGVVVVQEAKSPHNLHSQVPCGVFSNNFNSAAATVSNLYIDSIDAPSEPMEFRGASDVSVLQSGEAQTVSAEQSVAESAGSESSFSLQIVIGVAAFGMGAISVLALLALKQRVQQKAAMKPAQEEHVPEVSVSAVPETTTNGQEVAIEMEAKQETV